MKNLFILAICALISSVSCSNDDNGDTVIDKSGVFKGPDTQLFDGKAWTWVELDASGKPLKVAISIDDAALGSTTKGHGHGATGHDAGNHFVLPFHENATATIFNHVWLNWNPDGHEPDGIYNVPHFDIHYYMVSPSKRETFTETEKLENDMEAQYLPANHVGVHPIPAMGRHYVDTTSPELNGEKFTQTFIYGSYDREMIFLEPMITLEFLQDTMEFVRDIPYANKVQKSGYYPRAMRVKKHSGRVDVILEEMVYMEAVSS